MFLPEGSFTRTHRKYTVGGRNDYYGVDEYSNGDCQQNVDTFKTRKQADATAMHLNSAYYDGYRDAHIGLILPLFREVEHRTYNPETTVVIPAGTLVMVLGKDSAAFFQCEVAGTGLKFDCQFCDLREYPGK